MAVAGVNDSARVILDGMEIISDPPTLCTRLVRNIKSPPII
jgi:hypothetical protein